MTISQISPCHGTDARHFALDDHCEEIAGFVRSFYDRKVAARKAA